MYKLESSPKDSNVTFKNSELLRFVDEFLNVISETGGIILKIKEAPNNDPNLTL